MGLLDSHEFHAELGANFGAVDACEVVLDYGDARAEHEALQTSAGVLDLSFRSRLCVLGADRVRFLNGQVTNNIKTLKPGTGCYAAITNNKGKLQSDLNIHCLAEELLLDFEPGLAAKVSERLGKFIVADDVQIVDVAAHYGLLSVQGPRSAAALSCLNLFSALPEKPFLSCKATDPTLGELYAMNIPRLNTIGFDVFVPLPAMAAVADKLIAAAKALGGCACGWTAFESARIEAGIPRFGADMDESNLPQEAAIESRAVSFNKGCYIGQEVINRIRSMGHVNRSLCGLRLDGNGQNLPSRGDKLWHEGKEVGFITSATVSFALGSNLAMGYVRKECNAPGTKLQLIHSNSDAEAIIVTLPFVAE